MAEIQLVNGGVALVDDEDVPYLSTYRWHGFTMRSNLRYAMTAGGNSKNPRVYMHRLLMNAPDGLEVDHINGDPLDNRRSNLRVVTHQVNMRNRHQGAGSTGVRNVFLSRGKFQVSLTPRTGRIFIGSFDTLEEADTAARQARAVYYAVGTAGETLALVAARVRFCCLCRKEGRGDAASTGVLQRGQRFNRTAGKLLGFCGYVCVSHLPEIIKRRSA